MELTYKFTISDEAFDLLKKINLEGSAEYRDIEYESLEVFKTGETYLNGRRTEESFLARNFGGTYSLALELADKGLIDDDYDSWHVTFVMTEVGKEILIQNL